MNKIKNIWFNIRHFKFNSIFLRTFLFITALTVIPFIVLSIMFYSNTLKNIREEIALENSYIFDNSVNIIDRTLMEVDTLSSSLASNETMSAPIHLKQSHDLLKPYLLSIDTSIRFTYIQSRLIL